jgi:hypothetical protein
LPRSKKKPDYSADLIMREFVEAIADAFGTYNDQDECANHSGLNAVAAEFSITALKARKLLITAGVYSTETSRTIAKLYSGGKTIPEIMVATGLSRASIHSYLPYTKIPYNLKELSTNAERTKLYRERKDACQNFSSKIASMEAEKQDEALWELLEYLQGCVFYTSKGLKFTYTVKGGELFVNRKSKSITRSTVDMAFHKAMELHGEVTGPKKLGTFGASYLYPVFIRIGVIQSQNRSNEVIL